MEQTDYVTMRAPKPTLICTGTQDFFDIQGSWTTFREAKKIYGMIGHAERVDLIEYNDKHGFSQPRREAAMRWMRRWLLGVDDAPVETESPTFKDEELQCTPSGQVLAEFKGKSVFDLNVERAKMLAAKPIEHESLTNAIRHKIGLRQVAVSPDAATTTGLVKRDGYDVAKFTLTTEPGVRVSGLVLSANRPSGIPILALSGENKTIAAAPGGALEKWVKAGHLVMALDLRGLGETAPEVKSPFGADWKEAFLGIHLNRPLLGQRVGDVLAAYGGKGEVRLVASGPTTVVALHAAALHSGITEVVLEGGILSWSAVVRTPVTQNQLANVVPGALASYDLPDLAALIAPRKLTIKSPVDPAGKPVSQAELEAAYVGARAAYKHAGAAQNLVLQAVP
jgi:hypothetical protein